MIGHGCYKCDAIVLSDGSSITSSVACSSCKQYRDLISKNKPKGASVCEDCKGCERNSHGICKDSFAPIHNHDAKLFERCPWPSKRVEKRPEIKPCPFCGAKAIWENALIFSVEHNGACVFAIYTMHQKTEHAKYVLSSWNQRAAS